MVNTSVRAIEHELLHKDAAVAEIHAEVLAAGRDDMQALIVASMNSMDLPSFQEQVRQLQSRVLTDYAERVKGKFPARQRDRWRQLITSGVTGDSYHLLLEVGVPGAVLILDAIEPVPDETPAGSLEEALIAGVDLCRCGYAETRVVPRILCTYPCATSIGDEWVAEERRLLATSAELAAEAAAVLEETISKLAQVSVERFDYTHHLEMVIVKRAGRRLAQVNRRHREWISTLDLVRWRELAALAVRDFRPVPRREAKRWKRRGLGAASLSRMSVYGSAEVSAALNLIT